MFMEFNTFVFLICSLLSSCSSFRDSAYQDQDHQNADMSNVALHDGTDLNGIDKIFQGISSHELIIPNGIFSTFHFESF